MSCISKRTSPRFCYKYNTKRNPPSFLGLPRHDPRGRLDFNDRVRGLGVGLRGGRCALGFRKVFPRLPTQRRTVSVYDALGRTPWHDVEEDVPRALALKLGVERRERRPGI